MDMKLKARAMSINLLFHSMTEHIVGSVNVCYLSVFNNLFRVNSTSGELDSDLCHIDIPWCRQESCPVIAKPGLSSADITFYSLGGV